MPGVYGRRSRNLENSRAQGSRCSTRWHCSTVKLTNSQPTDPQDIGRVPVVNTPCWASDEAVDSTWKYPTRQSGLPGGRRDLAHRDTAGRESLQSSRSRSSSRHLPTNVRRCSHITPIVLVHVRQPDLDAWCRPTIGSSYRPIGETWNWPATERRSRGGISRRTGRLSGGRGYRVEYDSRMPWARPLQRSLRHRRRKDPRGFD